MAGIYLHIPFCRRLCGYCDFYKVISLQKKSELLIAMQQEISLQKDYLQGKIVETIYFGGGTPSVLAAKEIETLLQQIAKYHNISSSAEITLEANPDDLTPSYLKDLKKLKINRLSIGIQSFDDGVLQFMNRRHTAAEAVVSVKNAQQAGFENLSLDIIYGVPNTDKVYLKKNLQQLCDLQPQHISAYHLTVEEGTPFAHLKKRGKLQEIADENSEKQYALLTKFLQQNGYEQYEISNFAKNSIISRHNTSYWQQKPYLGIGPSAHSFNVDSRQWNVSGISKYINSIHSRTTTYKKEILSETDRIHDYIMVRLRTKWGMEKDYIREHFGTEKLQKIQAIAQENAQYFTETAKTISIKPKQFLLSDYLIAKFFVT